MFLFGSELHLKLFLGSVFEFCKVSFHGREKVFNSVVTDIVSYREEPRVCFDGIRSVIDEQRSQDLFAGFGVCGTDVIDTLIIGPANSAQYLPE